MSAPTIGRIVHVRTPLQDSPAPAIVVAVASAPEDDSPQRVDLHAHLLDGLAVVPGVAFVDDERAAAALHTKLTQTNDDGETTFDGRAVAVAYWPPRDDAAPAPETPAEGPASEPADSSATPSEGDPAA